MKNTLLQLLSKYNARNTVVVLMWCFCSAQINAATVDGVRLWAAPDNTRVVLDVSDAVSHKVFTLDKPNRVVIDIADSKINKSILRGQHNKGLLKKIRAAKRDNGALRMVLDLKSKAIPKSFLLKPNDKYGHRLVIDLVDTTKSTREATPVKVAGRNTDNDIFIVAIDAGHGGDDPGASGPHGVREKAVVLNIARKLAGLVNNEPGMKAVLVRDGDYYIGLRKRIEIARQHNADLFISIHADAFKDKRVKGASVYTLSNRGATSEAAKWLAAKENAADLVGGVSLDGKDQLLASVLLDLSQSATIEASLDFGSDVLSALKQVGPLHRKKVDRAGFVVLKSPDIPSILVETGFISNPSEEKRLKNPAHQKKVARAILSGIKSYAKKVRNTQKSAIALASATTATASSLQHKVKRGESLSLIAQKYKVSMDVLRVLNQLESDMLIKGQTLIIPN